MMRTQLDDVHERGEPLAALWASEETIYGRYGYGLASLNAQFDVDKSFSAFRPGVDTVGRVRLVDFDAAAKQLPPVYDAMQRVTPGMYERSETWWRNRQLVDPEDFRFGGSPEAHRRARGRRRAAGLTRSTACTSPSATWGRKRSCAPSR